MIMGSELEAQNWLSRPGHRIYNVLSIVYVRFISVDLRLFPFISVEVEIGL